MRAFTRFVAVLGTAVVASATLAGCASKLDKPTHSEITSQVPLAPTKDPNVFAWQSPDLDVSRYNAFLIDPVTVYDGSDADFGGISAQDRQALADLIGKEFKRQLGENYAIASEPGRSVVRLRLTLIGVNQSRPVLSTALRLLPIGLALTAVKSAADKPATFTGSVTLAGVALDSESGQPIGGVEALVAPPAYDLTSGLGFQRAAELGIKRAAGEFRDYVDTLASQR